MRSPVVVRPALWLLAALLTGCGAPEIGSTGPPGAAAGAVRRLLDPRGDAHGPGNYLMPQGDPYREEGFDLAALTLSREGGEILVEARFGGQVPVIEGARISRDLRADLFLPTVDVYLDLDGEPGSGEREALPGREVALAGAAGWEVALVLGPIPRQLEEALPAPAGGRVVAIAKKVVRRGDRLIARFSAALPGGASLEGAGVAAVVTGTVLTASFRGLVPGQVPTALVREVTAEPGRCDIWEEAIDGAPCTFGGAEPGHRHPRVLDALYPDSGVQERLLSRYLEGPETLGEIPLVYPEGRAAPAALAPRPRAALRDQKEGVATFVLDTGGPDAPAPGALVDGFDREGRPVAVFVVSGVRGAETGERVVVLESVRGDAERVVEVAW